MTVGEMLGGGARLVRTQPRALALWALLYLVAVTAMLALVWPVMVEMTAFQRQALTAQAAGAAVPAPPTGFVGAMVLMELLLVAALVAIFAAAVRATARGGADRFGFLRFGTDELRLVGLAILLWLIAMAAIFAFTIAAGLLTAAVYAAAGSGAAAIVLLPAWLAMAAAIVWAEVRISLAGAFTVLHGRMIVRAAWRATRGRFWTLLGAYLAIALVYFGAGLALTAILFPELFGLYAAVLGQGDPQAIVTAQQALFARMFGPRMIVGMAVGTALNTVLVGWLFGAIATAAVRLDGGQA